MPQKPLPVFDPPTQAEMRRLWNAYPDKEVRRLILEIEHLRRTINQAEGLREVIDRCWKKEVGGQLVGLHTLRLLLAEGRGRSGLQGENPTLAPPDADKRFPRVSPFETGMSKDVVAVIDSMRYRLWVL